MWIGPFLIDNVLLAARTETSPPPPRPIWMRSTDNGEHWTTVPADDPILDCIEINEETGIFKLTLV